MSDPFVAEIRMFAGNFAPRGWATCDGQILPLSQNTETTDKLMKRLEVMVFMIEIPWQ